ncbi:MAG: response regulator transcription factor [Cyanobacteria bacterium]|nr:response regulator transcription factor [Cyanobacteriota bacterium]
MPLTLLVADDDLGIRVAVGDYLEALGYVVTTAANGRLALDAINRIHPHLLVLDISMPEMSGYELVRQVRLEPRTRLLPVVFLTERNDTADRILGYQAGCDSYLAKPFELDELGAIVRNLLDRAQIVTDWRQSSPQSPTSSNTIVSALTLAQSPKVSGEVLELTPREREVVSLLSQGLSNPQIGMKLHLSPRTVEKHVTSLFRKTDTTNRAELVGYAIENQLR